MPAALGPFPHMLLRSWVEAAGLQHRVGQLLRAAGITFGDESAALLYERAEGWAAGLRLAVISLA